MPVARSERTGQSTGGCFTSLLNFLSVRPVSQWVRLALRPSLQRRLYEGERD